jgi:hypothetical protein
MLQLENVEFPKENDNKGVEVVATMDTFIAPLVEKLALAHPEWQFKSHYCRRYYTPNQTAEFSLVVERVQVVDKYEKLGEVGYDYTSKGKRFYVSNHRTEKMRERGSGVKTIHLDKAFKHVEKFFGRMNHGEKLEQASQATNEAVYRANNDTLYAVRNVWSSVDNVAMSFVLEHLDSFKSYMQTNTSPSAKVLSEIDKFPELVAEYEGMSALREHVNKNEHILVLLDGMNYIVKHAGRVEVKTSEELPDYVRRGVGMLKLVEVRNAITNIGIRVDENTFALLPPNNVS